MEAVCYINNCDNKKVVVQSLSPVWFFVTPWTAARQASLFFTISQNLLKLMSIESVMPSNHLISVTCFSSCPQSFPASGSFPVSRLFASGGQSIDGFLCLPLNWFWTCEETKWFIDLFDPNSYLTELLRKWNEAIHIISQSVASACSMYSNKC